MGLDIAVAASDIFDIADLAAYLRFSSEGQIIRSENEAINGLTDPRSKQSD